MGTKQTSLLNTLMRILIAYFTGDEVSIDHLTKKQKLVALAFIPILIFALIILSAVLSHFGVHKIITNIIALSAVFLGGTWRFMEGIHDLFHKHITVNVFVTVSLAATMAIGEFLSAAIVILIMETANAVETYSLDKNRNSIQDLLSLAPTVATLLTSDGEKEISIDDIQVGDIIVVKPGDRIPVDGEIVYGGGNINESAITGESVPAVKGIGDSLYAGTLNETGHIKLKANKIGQDTTLSKIVHQVEDAHELKAPVQKTADKFTAWFLPVVLVTAILGYIITRNIQSAVSILLVAAPCALTIGTPTAVTAGIANMSRQGVIVKGGLYFELAGKVDALVVDKTGTFTVGHPEVLDVVSTSNSNDDEVLKLATMAERYSDHPLARAVTTYADKNNIDAPEPEDFNSETGKGIYALSDGHQIYVGRKSYLTSKNISVPKELEIALEKQDEKGRSSILVAKDSEVIGLIAIADKIRAEAVNAVESLSAVLGVENIYMLTGDNKASANAVAKQIGIKNVYAELLPEDKLKIVKDLQSQGKKVGMVGDGINDAPALAQAEVGIAMGSSGTDVAIDTADVTLMNDNLTKIADFIDISRRVVKRIKINLFFAIVFNAVGILIGNLGYLNPVLAIILQEAGTVTVIISSTLLIWVKPKYEKKIKKKYKK